MHARNIVGRGIVIPGALENIASNLLLADFLDIIIQNAAANIQQQVMQPGRLIEVAARGNSLHQYSMRIRHFIVDCMVARDRTHMGKATPRLATTRGTVGENSKRSTYLQPDSACETLVRRL